MFKSYYNTVKTYSNIGLQAEINSANLYHSIAILFNAVSLAALATRQNMTAISLKQILVFPRLSYSSTIIDGVA
jgi:hypothetical protein